MDEADRAQPLIEAETAAAIAAVRERYRAAVRGRGSGLQGKGAALKKVPRTEVMWRNPRAVELCPRPAA